MLNCFKITQLCSNRTTVLTRIVPLRKYVQKISPREAAVAQTLPNTEEDVIPPKTTLDGADPSIALMTSRNFKPTVTLLVENPPAINKVPVFNPDDVTISQKPLKPVKGAEMAWRVHPATEQNKLKQYMMLSKIRLTSLVVITSMAGYAVAPAAFDPTTFVMCSVGTGLLSGAANSINQFFEVPFDAQMSRTKNRVLVKGYLTPLHAVGFATVAGATGISLLYYGCNGLTAALGATNLVLYTMIYTPMKRYSILNTWVGSIVGAIPPMMGWAACAGQLGGGAWIMAGLLYAWQFPHFNALSWNLRPDYSRAGYRMMAVTDPALCRRVALRYTVAITGLSLLAPVLDVTNQWFALETLPLNCYFTYLAWKFYQKSDSGSSRKLFRFSLLHLPLLMVLFLVNKKRWIFSENKAVTPEAIAATAITAEITKKSDVDIFPDILLQKQKL
ncbi:protoheme IX farnesyltransferase, mitochondrial [Culicoides brevitarsis]|uniref:protoheme IX farnesyltransferase, mitochondrial n=1 Tax=Culicoides brevitarsis TaxID=469753 RepID=UPI00307B27C4